MPWTLKDTQWRVSRVTFDRRPDPYSLRLERIRIIRPRVMRLGGDTTTTHVVPSPPSPWTGADSTNMSIIVRQTGRRAALLRALEGEVVSSRWRGGTVFKLFCVVVVLVHVFQFQVRNIVGCGVRAMFSPNYSFLFIGVEGRCLRLHVIA